MGTNTKRRTTMAKLNRENKLREKRMEKEARKSARKFDESDSQAPVGVFSPVPPPAPVEPIDESALDA
jgi:hypothetical protein